MAGFGHPGGRRRWRPRWPGKVKGKAADVSEHEDVHALFEFVDRETGGLDVLVNNAGVGTFAKVSRIGLDEWDKMIHTNLSGAFYCSREALSRFANRGAGYIVNISSLAGKNAFAGRRGLQRFEVWLERFQ